jgi:opacity protein-like surface antigen
MDVRCSSSVISQGGESRREFMRTKYFLMSLGLLVALGANNRSASAQKYELGLLIGGMTTGNKEFALPTPGTLEIGNGLTYHANYAQRLGNARLAALYFEVDAAGTPSVDVKSSNLLSPRNYSSFFLTPGLKVKFLAAAPYSPYVFAGVGYARFTESETRLDGGPNTGKRGTNHVGFDFGGGIDVRIFPFISLRGEIRDYVTGTPHFNVDILQDRQHNVLISGGVVFRFR